MSSEYSWLYSSVGSAGDAESLSDLARELESQGELHVAATAYDRAYGLQPNNAELAEARQKLLNRLAVVEHGIRFRYIPAGSFHMGSKVGDPDEQPVHPVELDDFWLSETPISWSTFCDLMDWEPPPVSHPKSMQDLKGVSEKGLRPGFFLREENKIRLQYCEDATTRAGDWHSHSPEDEWITGTGQRTTARMLFGEPPREDPRRPWKYDRKPMVSVSWQEAEELCNFISNSDVVYRLPTEAEWEKAARGGLINCLYPWGDDPPTQECCDFNRFDEFSILPMRRFEPNGYGLYAVSGCVWEWTSDWYDSQYYTESSRHNPMGPATGQEKVLRGGSWADCEEAVTVSFRMSRRAGTWKQGWGGHFAPNIGFRLCRVKRMVE